MEERGYSKFNGEGENEVEEGSENEMEFEEGCSMLLCRHK
jgi:hypothetical protein